MTEVSELIPKQEKREYAYQISDKVRDAIFLVRNDDLQSAVDDFLVMKDLMTAALPAPAASDVRAAAVTRQVGGTTGVVESCQHGDRVEKTGTGKNGKSWRAWDCPSRICDRKWVND